MSLYYKSLNKILDVNNIVIKNVRSFIQHKNKIRNAKAKKFLLKLR